MLKIVLWLLFTASCLVVTGYGKVTVYSKDPVSGKMKRIYLIAVGHDWGGYEYLNEGGFLAGFNYELIAAVCAEAGVDCRTVWEPYTNCVTSLPGQHMRGGQGLMDKWYDACMGYAATVGRSAIFKFGQSYLKDSRGGFFVKTDNNNFDPSNFGNSVIGFMDGWVDDEKCLARKTGTVLPASKVKHYKTTDELKKALNDGVVDAVFVGEGVGSGLKQVGDWQRCRLQGESIMTRKDSGFPAVWNEGFQKLVSSGRFKKICDEAEKKHDAEKRGYVIRCV